MSLSPNAQLALTLSLAPWPSPSPLGGLRSDFDRADDLRVELRGLGVEVHDRDKVWFIDNPDLARMSMGAPSQPSYEMSGGMGGGMGGMGGRDYVYGLAWRDGGQRKENQR